MQNCFEFGSSITKIVILSLFENFDYSVDYRELSVTFGDIKLFVPKGLKKTLEKLCKAILTEKPRNIPRFCANYFLAQLAQRAGTFCLMRLNVVLTVASSFVLDKNTI